MPFNITIDHEATRQNSDRSSSSATDEEDSSDTGVHLSPHSDSYDYQDPEEPDSSWTTVLHPDEIRPSDSASRPRTSNRQRPLVEAPQPEDARRQSYRRRITHDRIRNVPTPRSHHSPPSTEPESVDAHDEWQGDARGLQHGRQHAQYAPTGYPPAQYQIFPPQSVVPTAPHQQMVPFGFPGYQMPPGGAAPNYFAPQHSMPPHANSPYSPPGGYYPYAPQSFPLPPAMPPQTMFHPYPVYSPPPVVNTPPPPPPPDTSKDDEKFARLEKLLLDQKDEQAAKEAAAEKAAADKAAKAEAEAEKAKEIKAASDKAAKDAKEKADKEHEAAAKKAAKEAEQAAKDAEKAAAEAEAAKPPPPPPAERKKPIKFKDAVGRKFSFPFHLCNTWSGMEYLIKEAFTHVEVYGPHVDQGHYDLLGPQGEIILPNVWDTVVEPDWTVTMHMWPMNEDKEGDALADVLGGIEIVEEGLPPPPPPAPSAPGGTGSDDKKSAKKKKEKPPPLFSWSSGKKAKSTKGKKKG